MHTCPECKSTSTKTVYLDREIRVVCNKCNHVISTEVKTTTEIVQNNLPKGKVILE